MQLLPPGQAQPSTSTAYRRAGNAGSMRYGPKGWPDTRFAMPAHPAQQCDRQPLGGRVGPVRRGGERATGLG